MRISAFLGPRRCSIHIVSSWPTAAAPGFFLLWGHSRGSERRDLDASLPMGALAISPTHTIFPGPRGTGRVGMVGGIRERSFSWWLAGFLCVFATTPALAFDE